MIRLRNDGKQLLTAAIAYLVLDAIAVVLRLVAKSRTKRRFALDDLYIIFAFAAFVAWAGLIIGSKHIWRHWKSSAHMKRCD